MVTKKQLQELGTAIGFLAVTDINGLRNLLSKYGSKNVGDDSKTLISETTKLVSNPNFYKEFQGLLAQNLSETKSAFNNFTDPIPNQTNSTSKSGFFGGINLGGLLNTGVTIWSGINDNKNQTALVNAQADQQAQQIQGQILAGQLALDAEKLKLAQIQASKESKGGNTLLFVGLGIVGVLVIGGVIFALTKKKK